MLNSKTGISRRRFLASSLGLGSIFGGFSLTGQNEKAQAAEIAREENTDITQLPQNDLPVLPPGAENLERFSRLCTGCQLCVSACPHQALFTQMDGLNLLQPSLNFNNGYCHVDCADCSQICPTGAIQAVEARLRKRLQLGQAVLFTGRCLAKTEGAECSECAKHCPASAIVLADAQGTKLPRIDADLCIGCAHASFTARLHRKPLSW